MGYLAQYLSVLDAILQDPTAIEIAINADGHLWVERQGDFRMQPYGGLQLSHTEVADLAQAITNARQEKLTDQNPIVSTSVAYNSLSLRIQIIARPACACGTVIAMRLFKTGKGQEPKEFALLRTQDMSLEVERASRLAGIKALLQRGAENEFLQACVDNRLNIIISGGTSSGKTELGRRLLWMIDDSERLVTIEDALELLPRQPNVVGLVASRDDNSLRSAELLLQASLRLRPDRIIVGELRGGEAATFLQAINTGHGGAFTTLHAETACKAFDRLAMMVLESGLQLGYAEILRYLTGTIDVVIQTGRIGPKRGILEVWFPEN